SDGMKECAEWIPFERTDTVFKANRGVDVPHVSRIGIGEVALRVLQGFLQQQLKHWVATDDPIQGDDGRGRNHGTEVDEVAVFKLDGSKLVAACRFLSRGGEIGGRCVQCDRVVDATFEQLEAQSADTGTDIQKRSRGRTCLNEHVAQETSRRPRSLL